MHSSSSTTQLSSSTRPYAYQLRAFGPLWDERNRRIDALHWAETPDGDRIAARLLDCCRHPHIITYGDGLHYHLTEQRCRSRVCPRCSRIRARSLAARIAALVRRMDDPRFLTLTIRSTDQPLRDQVKHLRRRFAAMRRRPEWTSSVTGGVYTIEVTFNARSAQWHPHLHAIIDGRYFPHANLLRLWQHTVGAHAGVDIRAVRGVRKLANYLACYVAKSCDLDHLSTEQLAEWAVETHGLRLAQTFGRLQNCKPQSEGPDELEPLPIRYVEIDVHALAYAATHSDLIADQLLRLLEPRKGPRLDSNPSDVLRLIHAFNNAQHPTQFPEAPPRREREPPLWPIG